jgi:hypothetical protein
MRDLIEATSDGIEAFNGHTLQFFHHIQVPIRAHTPSVSRVGGEIYSPREMHDAEMSPL